MMRRNFPFRIKTLLIISFLVLAFVSLKAQENETRIDGATLCPGSQYVVPVWVSNLQNVDSIYLTLNIPIQTLSYLSFRQINPVFQQGTFVITNLNNQVTLAWKSADPVSIFNDKLVDLIFKVNNSPIPGNLEWDESLCYYRSSFGAAITSSYVNAQVSLFPSLFVEIEEIDATCPGQCNANIAAFVSGGLKPYQYLWNAETSPFDSILTGACGVTNNLLVKDANGCELDTNFLVSVLLSAKVDMEFEPDTVYIQNPVVKFSFTEDQNVVEWIWDFGDGSERSRERNPIHVYSTASTPDLDEYIVSLTVRSFQGCDTTILYSLPVSEARLFIPNVFTPNGDNINDVFVIAKFNDGGSSSGSNYIPINFEFIRLELIVLNRSGRKVYDNDNYKNNWDGGNLPEGTYFYRLNTFGYFKNETYKGAVTILRGSRN
ncbi:MAG: gliding motility-associated C-terminal domain-containing protein [Lentimicrobium sp.]|nr:gliding motility-associated C-terminal domain-containing protein [Lentimicrobium sp.]